MRAASWWAEYLRGQGVNFAFGQGGVEVVEHLEALRAAGIELIWMHHEASAAFAAAAIGELTSIPGLCVATRGPGATNLMTGVAHAWLDRAPLLAVTGDTGEPERSSVQHQTLPLTRLFEPVVKRSVSLTAGNVGSELPLSFDLTTDDPVGPVFLSFPQSEARREVTEALTPTLSQREREMNPSPAQLAEVRRYAVASRRPLIYVGLCARELEAERLLLELAERLGAPVVCTPKAKGHFPADHRRFAGVYPAYCAEPVKELLRQADLIVGVGLDPVEMPWAWPFEAPVVAIGPSDSASYFPDCVEVPVATHPALVDAVGLLGKESDWPADAAAAARREVLRLLEPAASRGSGVAPQKVLWSLRRKLRRDAIVACDVGSHRHLTTQAWPAHWPRTFLTSNGLSSVGYALPAALAAKLACLDREVACLVGDGGLLACLGELQTLARLRLRVLVVVWADEGSSSARLEHESAGFPAGGGTFVGTTDFAAVARSLGLWAKTVDCVDQVEVVLAEALAQHGPALVQVRVSYGDYRGMAL